MFRLPAGVRNLSFLQLVQSEHEDHPASDSAGKGRPFLGLKWPGREARYSSLSSAQVIKVCSYISTPPCTLLASSGTVLPVKTTPYVCHNLLHRM